MMDPSAIAGMSMLVGIVVMIVAYKYLRRKGEGFFAAALGSAGISAVVSLALKLSMDYFN